MPSDTFFQVMTVESGGGGSSFVLFSIIWTPGRSELCRGNQKVCMMFYCRLNE